jgi:hypothetical protein
MEKVVFSQGSGRWASRLDHLTIRIVKTPPAAGEFFLILSYSVNRKDGSGEYFYPIQSIHICFPQPATNQVV